MRLSFVVPVFNECESVEELVGGIFEYCRPHECEIILVDDGSTDGSGDAIDGLAGKHADIVAIRFARNRGKSAALEAGIRRASGDVVFTMDSDLQDDPKEIPQFLEKLAEGYDLVCGWKAVRLDPGHKTVPSFFYNRMVARLFGLPIHDVNCGYKAMRIEVAKSLRLYGDRHRLVPVIAAARGFQVAEIAVRHHARRHGKSKFGIERFSRGAIDLATLWFLIHYRSRPAHFFGLWGAAAILAGLAAGTVSIACLGSVAGLVLGTGLAVGGALFAGLGLIAELAVSIAGESDPDIGGGP